MCEKPSNGVNSEYLCMCISYAVAFCPHTVGESIFQIAYSSILSVRTFCTESLFDSVQAKRLQCQSAIWLHVIGT